MALPEHHFQPRYQLQQQQQTQLESIRNFPTVDFDGQMSQPVSNYEPTGLLHRPFNVGGFASCDDESLFEADLQWYSGLEDETKGVKEQDLQENKSQKPFIDFMQTPSVSTGLGLSLDNTCMPSAGGDSSMRSLIGEDIDRELLQQDAELDRFLRVQGEQLRATILKNVQETRLQSISLIEDNALKKHREKEAELESIRKRNIELEEKIEKLIVESDVWKERTKYNMDTVVALKFMLEDLNVQGKDNHKEGFDESEVDDTASCMNGHSIPSHLLSKEKNHMKEMVTCKACGVNEVSVLLLPCKHLCLCKECESKLSFCPLCQSSKMISIKVIM